VSQAIALQSQFQPIDMPGIVDKAQRARANDYKLQNAPLAAEVERMGLSQDLAKSSALDAYRKQAGETNDPISALDKLNAYPEEQTKLYEAMDGLPVQERVKAKTRADTFGRAARYVMSFPEGSAEQKQAWETSIKVLYDDGFIDEDVYQQAVQSGPNKMILNEALQMSEWMKLYTGPKAETEAARRDLYNARVDDIGADNERMGRESDARISRGDLEAGNRNANRDARTGAMNEQGDARVGIMRDRETNKVQSVKPGASGGKGGLTAAQRINILKGIDEELQEMRDNGEDDAAVAARESFLMQRYGLADTPQQLESMTGSTSSAAAPQKPPGTTETKSRNGKTYHKIDGKWFVAE
jgi:hypothetical protein